MHILKALVALYPCTKFREISSKGVGAREHKAEKQNWPLRGQFWPLGVETYMTHVPYQDARTLQVLGLCDPSPLPSEIFSNALSARTRHWFVTSHLCDQSDRRN